MDQIKFKTTVKKWGVSARIVDDHMIPTIGKKVIVTIDADEGTEVTEQVKTPVVA